MILFLSALQRSRYFTTTKVSVGVFVNALANASKNEAPTSGLEPLTCSLRVSRSSPSAIEVLTLTIFALQLHHHQLDLGGFLVQQGAEA